MQIRTMSTLECAKLLEQSRVGALACAKDGQPYVVPISFAYSSHNLYAFSMVGQKVQWMRQNHLVSMMVEQRGQGRAWKSVVIDGRFEELVDRIGSKAERERAWSVLSKHADWWEPGALSPEGGPVSSRSDHVFFRIHVDQISGREARE